MLYLSNCLIRCVCKKSFLSFSYFPWLLLKKCKIKTNLSEIGKALPPPLPFCHCYVLQYSSFWNHKAKIYGIKTSSYAHKTTSYAHKTTSYAHKTTSYEFKTFLLYNFFSFYFLLLVLNKEALKPNGSIIL